MISKVTDTDRNGGGGRNYSNKSPSDGDLGDTGTRQKRSAVNVSTLCQLTSRYDIPLRDISWTRTTFTPGWLAVNHHTNQPGESRLTLINPHRTQSADPVEFLCTLPVVRAEVHPTRDLIALSTAPTIIASSEKPHNLQQERRNSETSSSDGPNVQSLLAVFVIHSGFPVNSLDLLSLQTDKSLQHDDNGHDGLAFASLSIDLKSDYDFFWTWITSDLIGIVTREAIFHWDVFDSDSIPQLITKRHFKMGVNYDPGLQITNYMAEESGQWFALIGLTTRNATDSHFLADHMKNSVTPTGSQANFADLLSSPCGSHGSSQVLSYQRSSSPRRPNDGPEVCGFAQIYSRRDDFSQLIELHALTFVRHTFIGNSSASTVLIGARRTTHTQAKIYLIELGPIAAGNLALVSRSESILWYGGLDATSDVHMESSQTSGHTYEGDLTQEDFPTVIRASAELGLIYILSKRGVLLVCDLDSGTHLFRSVVLPLGDIILAAAYDPDTHGLLTVTRNGSLLSVEPDVSRMVAALQGTSRRFIAARLEAAQHTLSEASHSKSTRL